MLGCILRRRKLYEYLDNSLSEIERLKVGKHLNNCPPCRKKLNQMQSLIDLVKNKKTPEPSEDFWHKFRVELDANLNSRLVAPFNFKPQLNWRLRPALAISLASVIILTGIYLFSHGRPLLLADADADLVEEIDLLEELSPDSSFTLNEDIELDKLSLWGQQGHIPA